MLNTNRILIATFATAILAAGQNSPNASVPTQMIVTIGHVYGKDVPVLTQNDLTITHEFEPLPITKLSPLRGDRAGLELFVLIDNCSNCEPGPKFDELRRFITTQPATTAIGIAYIRDGRLEIAENPTSDHERAAKALNVPAGGTPSNPFSALTDLIARWNPGSSRRAVLMISSGIDPSLKDAFTDPSADAVIEAAQRGRVSVYAIYHPSADWDAADGSKIYAGQVRLAHVANETGGEAYFISFGPLPSLAPFLSDVAEHLANQYLLEFLAPATSAPGALQEFTVKSKLQDVELVAPAKAWVGVGTNVTPKQTSRKLR